MKIALLIAAETEPFAPDHMGWIQGAKKLGLEYKVIDPIKHDATAVTAQVAAFDPDLVFHGMNNSLEAAQSIRNGMKAKQVFAMFDYRPDHNRYDGMFDSWVEISKSLDHVFLSNHDQIPWWREELHAPVDYMIHGSYIPPKPVTDKTLAHPTVFMGGMNDEPPLNARKKLIEEIKSKIDITHVHSYDRDQRNQNWKDMPGLYHSSDTVLDISHFWDVEGYASGRFFYAGCLGGCSITKRFPGCEELFPADCKAYFDTVDEAVELIRYYRTHHYARREMKRKAYYWGKEHHNCANRLQQMIQCVST